MPDDNYSVKINRREGIVEVAGPDKEWISTEVEKYRAVFESPAEDADHGSTEGSGTSAGSNAEAKAPAKRTAKRARRSAPAPRAASSDSRVAEVLDRAGAQKLKDFIDERNEAQLKSDPKRAAVVATFLLDEFEIEEVESNDLIIVSRAMGWPPPRNPSGTLSNGASRYGYFSRGAGKARLTPTGEHFGRVESKNAP